MEEENIISQIYENNENFMKDLFDKYHKGLNIFENETSYELKNEFDMNLFFSEYQIATMTVNAIIPIDLNYNCLISILRNIDIIKIDSTKDEFYNSLTFKIIINENTLNVKYFKNGSIQITGCKNLKNIDTLILYLINIIKENKDDIFKNIDLTSKIYKFLEKKKIVELRTIGKKYSLSNTTKFKKKNLIENIIEKTNYIQDINIKNKYSYDNIDRFDIKDSEIKISMINCSYQIFNNVNGKNISFKIDRKKFFNFLKQENEYNLNCYYDNTQHQGIKINIMYNSDMDGICKCSEKCILLNKKKRSCKKITVLIFNSAKIVITGANDIKQTELSYKIINDIINKHYKKFVQLII